MNTILGMVIFPADYNYRPMTHMEFLLFGIPLLLSMLLICFNLIAFSFNWEKISNYCEKITVILFFSCVVGLIILVFLK